MKLIPRMRVFVRRFQAALFIMYLFCKTPEKIRASYDRRFDEACERKHDPASTLANFLNGSRIHTTYDSTCTHQQAHLPVQFQPERVKAWFIPGINLFFLEGSLFRWEDQFSSISSSILIHLGQSLIMEGFFHIKKTKRKPKQRISHWH